MDKLVQGNFSFQPLLESRIFAYDLLRRVFIEEPSKDFIKNLASNFSDFPFSEEHAEIAKGTKGVQDYLAEHDINTEDEFEKLHWDYTRLFIGPYELPAPPWESTYINKDKLLFQEETRQVRLAYLKYAFLPKQYLREADDHIGLELDFMYQLSLMVYEKFNAGDSDKLYEILKDQREFLTEHLLKWVPKFTDKVKASTSTRFYLGMAEILNGYLTIDESALNELIVLKS